MRALMVLAAALAFFLAPSGAAAAPPSEVQVTLDKAQSSAGVGDRIEIRARVVNSGAERTGRLVAHLNVATLDESVYVDLEDWTASPTQELASLAPGGSTSASWEIQAVNVGSFDVYVVVLPDSTASAGQASPTASPPQLVQVAGRQTLSPGGALPVAFLTPVLLGLVAVAIRLRLRLRS